MVTSSSCEEDAEWQRVLRNGDRAGFERLLMRSNLDVRLERWIGQRVPIRDVEDLMQEIWLAVWLKGRQYDPARGHFRAWLFGIARHRISDHYRRLTTRFKPLLYDSEWWEGVAWKREEREEAPTELIEVVREAVDRLSKRLKEILTVYLDNSSEYDGRRVTAAELGATLEPPASGVGFRVGLRRARQFVEAWVRRRGFMAGTESDGKEGEQ